MNGCIYRTKDGECDLYSEGGKFKAFCVGNEPCEGRKLSNADRIRSMTDKELAEWITIITTTWRKDIEPWLDWLKQEATE